MEPYEKIGWIDHIRDIISGKVIQEGTPVSQKNMNHRQIADNQREIKVLKDATLNNMVNNVFLVTFPAVDSVAIQSGIYDPAARKIYV